MDELITFTRRRRVLVLVAWVVAVLAALPLMMRQSDHLTAGGYEVKGSGSYRVQQLLAEKFPDLSQEQLVLVVSCDESSPSGAVNRQLDRAVAEAGFHPSAATVPPAAQDAAMTALAQGKRQVALPLHVTTGWTGSIDLARDLGQRFATGGEPGCRTAVAGRGAQAAALQHVSESGLKQAELVGMPVLLVMLLVIFGSLAAAILPLVLAGASLVITGAVIYLISLNSTMSVFSLNMASMIGLGVAVDYALFVVLRFREELRNGATVEEARATSLRTSGVAVVASGATVVAALSSVFVVDNAALRSMALGAMFVVCIAVLATVTLLPPLLAMLASRIGRAKRRSDESSGFWFRWTKTVLDRPITATGVALVVLVALISPIFSIQMGDDTLRQLSSDNTTRQAAEIARQLQGPGADAPVVITVEPRPNAGANVDSYIAHLLETLRGQRLVTSANIVGAQGSTRVVALILGTDYESDAARAFVREIRTDILPASGLERASVVSVGGATASGVDLIELIHDRLVLIVGLILLLAYILLAFLLRSLVLPLKAIITNLLSVGAGFGVIVALFQWGWLSSLTGIEPIGHVQSLALPLILAVVFGLSMDYEVFLLTRIRERWVATGDDRQAVAAGVASTAGAISSAAVIMVAVFASFVFTGIPVVQQLGVGCGVAVGVDATITRLILVPATMALLGKWNWYFPAFMQRKPRLAEVLS